MHVVNGGWLYRGWALWGTHRNKRKNDLITGVDTKTLITHRMQSELMNRIRIQPQQISSDQHAGRKWYYMGYGRKICIVCSCFTFNLGDDSLGLRPRPPRARESAFGACYVRHADGKGRQFPSSPRASETLGRPLDHSLPLGASLAYRWITIVFKNI